MTAVLCWRGRCLAQGKSPQAGGRTWLQQKAGEGFQRKSCRHVRGTGQLGLGALNRGGAQNESLIVRRYTLQWKYDSKFQAPGLKRFFEEEDPRKPAGHGGPIKAILARLHQAEVIEI